MTFNQLVRYRDTGIHKVSVSFITVQRRLVPLLLMLLCVSEFLYLLLLALSPLPWLHLFDSPMATSWTWTLLPSQLLLAISGTLLTTTQGHMLFSPLLLGLTFLALVGAYAWAIAAVYRAPQDEQSSHGWLLFVLGCTAIFGLTLLFQPKLFSDDVFTYIFSGRILTFYTHDPLNTAPIQFPSDPYLQWVISGRNDPNIYGPLWLCIASLLVSFSHSPVITLLLFKGLALTTHLINCVLVWAILSQVAPQRKLFGTLLYAWNPLALIELAGSGHSEGVLLTLLLLTTWLYVMGEGHWRSVAVLLIFGLAISMNTIVLLLGPLYIWFDIRTRKTPSRMFWGCTWRALVMLLPALLISLPFWRGATTFFALTSAIDMQHFVHSPVGLLAFPIRAAFTGVDKLLHFPDFLLPITSADITLRASATFIFALIYFDLFGQVRRAPSTIAGMRYSLDADQQMTEPGSDMLLKSWCAAIFWYVVLVSGWFWPWYVLWMFWIAVLRRFDTLSSTIIVLSGTALFLYMFLGLTRETIAVFQPAVIFGIPLLYLIIVATRERLKERTQVGL